MIFSCSYFVCLYQSSEPIIFAPEVSSSLPSIAATELICTKNFIVVGFNIFNISVVEAVDIIRTHAKSLTEDRAYFKTEEEIESARKVRKLRLAKEQLAGILNQLNASLQDELSDFITELSDKIENIPSIRKITTFFRVTSGFFAVILLFSLSQPLGVHSPYFIGLLIVLSFLLFFSRVHFGTRWGLEHEGLEKRHKKYSEQIKELVASEYEKLLRDPDWEGSVEPLKLKCNEKIRQFRIVEEKLFSGFQSPSLSGNIEKVPSKSLPPFEDDFYAYGGSLSNFQSWVLFLFRQKTDFELKNDLFGFEKGFPDLLVIGF